MISSVKFAQVLLFLTLFTLPNFTFVNNVFLGLYMSVVFLKNWKSMGKRTVWLNLKLALPLFLFFLLSVIASFNGAIDPPLSNLERYWSYLLIPMAFLVQEDFYRKNKNIIYNGLLFGCAFTLLLCYGNVIKEMYMNSEPLGYFLRWRHVGVEFAKIADTHPSYLGLFLAISSAVLYHDQQKTLKPKLVLGLFFTLGIFQLASRMAMFLFACLLVYIIIDLLGQRQRKKVVTSLFILATISLSAILFGSEYFKKRMFDYEMILNDKRFERMEVSLNLFKANPIIGMGFDQLKIERKKELALKGYEHASKENYNAHNQFFEFLGSNGILGGMVYVGVFLYLMVSTAKARDWLFLYIFLSIFLANLTESMLVRIKGIEFYCIFAMLWLTTKLNVKKLE